MDWTRPLSSHIFALHAVYIHIHLLCDFFYDGHASRAPTHRRHDHHHQHHRPSFAVGNHSSTFRVAVRNHVHALGAMQVSIELYTYSKKKPIVQRKYVHVMHPFSKTDQQKNYCEALKVTVQTTRTHRRPNSSGKTLSCLHNA